MEERQSRLKPKKQIAPKITNTKITISKSTPFFIRKHHLDDTQISVLNYDQTVKNCHPRTYSYRAQVVSCKNSKFKQPYSTFQNPSNQISRPIETARLEQYYPKKQNKSVQASSRVYKSRITSQQNTPTKKSIQKPVLEHRVLQQNDYGLQTKKLSNARKKLQRQTERLKTLYKKNIRKDIQSNSRQKIKLLEQQIRQMKIKNLQKERDKLIQQLNKQSEMIKQYEVIKQQSVKNEQHVIEHKKQRSYAIVQRLPIQYFHFKQDNYTDSQFSSFQIDS